jgi:hypothetical protein
MPNTRRKLNGAFYLSFKRKITYRLKYGFKNNIFMSVRSKNNLWSMEKKENGAGSAIIAEFHHNFKKKNGLIKSKRVQ